MEEEKQAPAILLFKENKDMILKLSDEDRLALFDAILQYAIDKTTKSLSYVASIVFEVIKMQLEANEKRYRRKCEKNKKYYDKKKASVESPEDEAPKDKEKARGSPPGKKEPKSNEIQRNLSSEQAHFFEAFKTHCSNKALDCQIAEMPACDYTALMLAIKQSQFLLTSDNLSLRWCLEHAEEIIAGKYKTYADEVEKPGMIRHNYSKEQNLNLFDNVEDVEI